MDIKLSTFAIIVALFCCGCSERKVVLEPSLSVSCSPQELDDGQWGVLTIAQVFPPGVQPLEIREDKLGKVALFAMRTKILGGNEVGGGHQVQVYVIKPLDKKVITLDSTYFSNVPAYPPILPLHISPTKKP